jgi:hypothetical protein
MQERVITEPLRVGTMPMMDAELRAQMLAELKQEMEDMAGVAVDTRYIFDCHHEKCGARINPFVIHIMPDGVKIPQGIPTIFFCPKCGTKYQASGTGVPGGVVFKVMKEEGLSETVSRPAETDQGRGDEARRPDGDGDDPNFWPSDEV